MRRCWVGAVGTITLAGLVSITALGQKTPEPPTPTKKQQPVPKTRKAALSQQDQQEIIFNILEEAHTAAEELPTAQKIPILQDLCGRATFTKAFRHPTAAPVPIREGANRDPEPLAPKLERRAKAWAEELYTSAEELPQGSYAKLAAQAAAVRAMVPLDENRALAMMDGLEASDAQGAAEQQNYLAVYLFSELIKSHGDKIVPELRLRAQNMASRGQYPYIAMLNVARNVSNTEQIRAIFNDALSSFQTSQDKLNSMLGMLSLTRDEKIRASLQAWQVQEASVAIANRLKSEIDLERRAYDQGQPMRPGLPIIARGVKDGLMDIDPELAATLPELPPYTPASAKQTMGDGTPAGAQVTPELRKMQSDFEKTSTRLMEMSEDEVHQGTELRQLIDKGVEQGSELLRSSVADAKDHVAALERAMPPVTDFIQVGARTNPAMTLAAVRRVQDSEIRARMLITIAVGLPDPSLKY